MTQQEFDYQMQVWGEEQIAANHPLLDEQRAINQKREQIKAEIATLRARLSQLGVRWHEVEQKRKDINRHYYELKHQFGIAHLKEEIQRDTELARLAREQKQETI
ncbi:MAG: hypothetical protein SPF09_00970 [Bacteroidaceae bacterium]|nr:hypothetical protein [Bacteroidaceae bacterium]